MNLLGAYMNIEVGGFLGFIILVLDIWAIISIIKSGASTGSQVLWVLLIILLPVVGLIIWWFAGPKGA
jgi:succinate dehydrogenase/fumarate reductase cytochrome b subunit